MVGILEIFLLSTYSPEAISASSLEKTSIGVSLILLFFNLCIWSSRVSTYVDLSGQGKTVAKYIRDTVYTSVSGLVKSMLSHCGST